MTAPARGSGDTAEAPPRAGRALVRGAAGRRARDLGPRLIVPLCAGAVLNPVNSTMIATARSPIGREFGVGAGRRPGWCR